MLRSSDIKIPESREALPGIKTKVSVKDIKDKRKVLIEVSSECVYLLDNHASNIVFDEIKGFDPIPQVYRGVYVPSRDYFIVPVEHPALPIVQEGYEIPVMALENLKERITKYQEKENDRTERELLKWVFLPGGNEPPRGNAGEPDGFHSRPATLSG